MAKIFAYSLRTKTKNVLMLEAIVSKTSRGGYIAKGVDEHGNKMSAIMSEVNALAAIASKDAKKGF